LGRLPKAPEISAAHKQQLSADQRKRNEVDGCFGSGKRKYSLDLIMARLSNPAETLISMAFLVMCVEKILRFLRLLFITMCAWFDDWQEPGALLEKLRTIWQLEMASLLVAA
jgi:IS5 family transposase